MSFKRNPGLVDHRHPHCCRRAFGIRASFATKEVWLDRLGGVLRITKSVYVAVLGKPGGTEAEPEVEMEPHVCPRSRLGEDDFFDAKQEEEFIEIGLAPGYTQSIRRRAEDNADFEEETLVERLDETLLVALGKVDKKWRRWRGCEQDARGTRTAQGERQETMVDFRDGFVVRVPYIALGQ